MPESEERTLAACIYLISLVTVFIGPLLIWLLKKDHSVFIDFHGRAYFNFLISYCIYGVVASILTIFLIGFILLPLIGLMAIIFTILGAVKAYEGKEYTIPLCFRII